MSDLQKQLERLRQKKDTSSSSSSSYSSSTAGLESCASKKRYGFTNAISSIPLMLIFFSGFFALMTWKKVHPWEKEKQSFAEYIRQNPESFKFLLLAFNMMIITFVVSPLIKLFGKAILGDGARRPAGACGCGTMVGNPMIRGSTRGMPSGHAMEMGFFAVFFAMMFSIKSWDTLSFTLSPFMIAAPAIIAFIVIAQRFLIGCHTMPQLFVGTLIGMGLGVSVFFINYFIVRSLMKNNPEIEKK